jgi:hypothetical protein
MVFSGWLEGGFQDSKFVIYSALPDSTFQQEPSMKPVRQHKQLPIVLLSWVLLFLSAGLVAQQDATTPEAAAPDAKPKKVSYSNKWRLQFSGNAESDGEIVLKLIPKEGEPVQTTTPIKKGTSENNVAKELVKSLKAQLDKKVYHVERDDGEDVLVKKKYGAKDFGIEIVALTVKNVRISPRKE